MYADNVFKSLYPLYLSAGLSYRNQSGRDKDSERKSFRNMRTGLHVNVIRIYSIRYPNTCQRPSERQELQKYTAT